MVHVYVGCAYGFLLPAAADYSDPLTIELLQLATLLMRCHTAKLAQSDYRQQLLTFGCAAAFSISCYSADACLTAQQRLAAELLLTAIAHRLGHMSIPNSPAGQGLQSCDATCFSPCVNPLSCRR